MKNTSPCSRLYKYCDTFPVWLPVSIRSKTVEAKESTAMFGKLYLT